MKARPGNVRLRSNKRKSRLNCGNGPCNTGNILIVGRFAAMAEKNPKGRPANDGRRLICQRRSRSAFAVFRARVLGRLCLGFGLVFGHIGQQVFVFKLGRTDVVKQLGDLEVGGGLFLGGQFLD